MPKLSDVVCKTAPLRKFNNYKPNPYKYKIVLPPVLRDEVSNRGQKTNKAVCVQEMSTMMVCFKRNNYDESLCHKEVTDFTKCVVNAKEARRRQEQAITEGKTLEGTGKQSAPVVNKLLSRYPQPKSHFYLE
ncbi:hypothetical protein SNE40_019393 [Patella caerulea]|uniref:CHCH domain-containing protein n=1 Tax=Patella caerulea TaxID=87958 RepID=A0AAN8JAH1_PATCE